LKNYKLQILTIKFNVRLNLDDRAIPKIDWEPTDLSKIDLPDSVEITGNKKIVIISDANPADYNLLKMLDLFERQVSHKVERIDLNEIEIKGGCIGCLRCGNGDACFYKDEYAEAFEKVKKQM